MFRVGAAALLGLLLLAQQQGLARAQFKCTLNASDEDTCLATVGDDDQHCAWCSLGGFAFCMSEQAAEAMEQTLHAECDRYSGTDDDHKPKPTADDDVRPPATDDEPAKDDDTIKPTDDALPDNFWTCLQEKDRQSCDGSGCTWCTAKSAGFSLCMSGPAAEQAEHSAFFACESGPGAPKDAVVADPYDASCVNAYLKEQTEDACVSTMDQDGDSCQWCSLAGLTNLCLTPDQAEMGRSLGIKCEAAAATGASRVEAAVLARMGEAAAPLNDASCMVAFLKDHSAEGCASAVDTEGSPCEYCPVFDGAMNLCLTLDQVAVLDETGYGCQNKEQLAVNQNPYDVSCVMASFSGSDKEGCVSTLDEDGVACRYCSVQGMASLCLTSAQADLASGYGLSCEQEEQKLSDNPYDTSCLMAYLQDQSQEGCVSSVGEDGVPCEYCSLSGFNICLTPSQAEMAGGLGVECAERSATLAVENDMFDMSCIKAFLSDQTEGACRSAHDEDGAACKWCHTPQAGDVCLTATQGDIAGQIGMWCDDSKDKDFAAESEATVKNDKDASVPADFWTCLQNFDESGCSPSCTWCKTNVGMGFCLSTPVAQATKECTFFDCDFKDNSKLTAESNDPYDPSCLGAGMGGDDAEEVCSSTLDREGQNCVWCDAAGVFGVCVSADQASAMGQYLQCGTSQLTAVA